MTMGWEAHRKSPPGHSGDPSPTPYNQSFLQTGGSQPPRQASSML